MWKKIIVCVVVVVVFFVGFYVGGHINMGIFGGGGPASRTMGDSVAILSATSTNGAGTVMIVDDWQHIVCAMDTLRTSSYTLKFAGSISDGAPIFNNAAASTNQWDYIEVVDLQDGNTVDGDTGLTYANQEDHRMFEVNTDLLKWVNVILSSVTQPTTTTLICKGANNQ